MKMKIKTGDRVQMLSGKDGGKSGKVIQVFPQEGKVVVEGLNRLTKHLRPRREADAGQKVTFWRPVRAAAVILLCPKCSRPTRLGIKTLSDGSRVRICKKCGETV